ncbi:hypothetical protein NPIL_356791, partial [Nephila pilipes]
KSGTIQKIIYNQKNQHTFQLSGETNFQAANMLPPFPPNGFGTRGAVTGTQPNHQVHTPTRRALGLSSHAVRPEIPIGCFFGHDLSLRRLFREEGR